MKVLKVAKLLSKTGISSYNRLKAAAAAGALAAKGVNYMTKRLNDVTTVRRPRKGYRTGKRKVVVSKKLTRQIKSVALKTIHDEKPTGTFIKSHCGVFPKTVGGGMSVENRFFIDSTQADAVMTHFCVGGYVKLIDAVSVLFGTKTAAVNYVVTDNLNPAQMIIPSVKHVQNLEFRNNSPVPREIWIYETTPKEDTNNNVSTSYAAMTLTQQGGTTRSRLYYGMQPELFPQFKDAYRILKKKYLVIQPGASFKYTLTQSADHIKFDKWMAAGTTTPFNYRKGFTKELLVIEAIPLAGITENTEPVEAVQFTTSNNSPLSFLAVFSRERITMKCPENIANSHSKDNTVCVVSAQFAGVGMDTTRSYTNKTIENPLVWF